MLNIGNILESNKSRHKVNKVWPEILLWTISLLLLRSDNVEIQRVHVKRRFSSQQPPRFRIGSRNWSSGLLPFHWSSLWNIFLLYYERAIKLSNVKTLLKKRYSVSIITLAIGKLKVVIHFTRRISQFLLDTNHFNVTTSSKGRF